MRELQIAGHRIADDTDAYVVAEIGCNHGGSEDVAMRMIQAASECGCDAVKLQKRDMATWANRDPELWNREYNSEHSYGRTYGEHRAALELDADTYRRLQGFAKDRGLAFFATAWDRPSLDFLLDLHVPAVKLASAQATDLDQIEAALRGNVPVILSTGGTDFHQVNEAIHTEHRIGGSPLAILHCTAEYPCPPSDMNLNAISSMCWAFADTVIGLSDHQSGIAMGPVAYALGARIFEKHFTLSRTMKGSDHVFSLEPAGMRKFVRDLRRVRLALGDGIKRVYPGEIEPLRKMGRRDLAVPI